MTEVVTVLGSIRPDELGVTDAHDHLFLRSPALPGQEFEDLDRAVEEVSGAARGGLQAVVEATPIGLGRNPAKLRAVAEATGVQIVAATGSPILVHTEIGTCAHEIIDLLTREGVKEDRIILAHLDRNPDLELHAGIAARGVTLEYDTPGRIKYRPDSQLLDLVEAMVHAGHAGSMMLGLDLGQRDYFRY